MDEDLELLCLYVAEVLCLYPTKFLFTYALLKYRALEWGLICKGKMVRYNLELTELVSYQRQSCFNGTYLKLNLLMV